MAGTQRRGNPCPLLVGTGGDAAAVENSLAFPHKVKHGITR